MRLTGIFAVSLAAYLATAFITPYPYSAILPPVLAGAVAGAWVMKYRYAVLVGFASALLGVVLIAAFYYTQAPLEMSRVFARATPHSLLPFLVQPLYGLLAALAGKLIADALRAS